MLNWVKKHRPPIVILENVCSAPWPAVVEKFEDVKYSAKSIRLDTKAYYVPHTRTRGYMMAVNAQSSSIPNKWVDRMAAMKRDASCTLDAFLLPSDDPRIHQAREKLVQESYNAQDRKSGRTDWGRCESRHQRTRLEEALGAKRPLTNWDEGMWRHPFGVVLLLNSHKAALSRCLIMAGQTGFKDRSNGSGILLIFRYSDLLSKASTPPIRGKVFYGPSLLPLTLLPVKYGTCHKMWIAPLARTVLASHPVSHPP